MKRSIAVFLLAVAYAVTFGLPAFSASHSIQSTFEWGAPPAAGHVAVK